MDAQAIDRIELAEFSLARGGPFHRLLRRLGLARPSRIGFRALVLALVAWVPPVALAFAQHRAVGGPGALLHDVQFTVRLLVGIPLLVLADPFVDRRLGDAVRYLDDGGLIGAAERPALVAAWRWLARRCDAVLPEVAIVLLAWLATWPEHHASTMRSHATWKTLGTALGADVATQRLSLAGWWYALVSAPLFDLLLLRWLWRLCLWAGFLSRLLRAPLRLSPTHPDRSAGLGVLGDAHVAFAPLVFAVSAVAASSMANHMLRTGVSVLAFRVPAVAVLVVTPCVFLTPLLVFTPALRRVRLHEFIDYSAAVTRFAHAYEERWAHPQSDLQQRDLASSELSTYCDLGTSYERAARMRLVPITLRTLLLLAVAALIPLLALALTEVPAIELIRVVRGLL